MVYSIPQSEPINFSGIDAYHLTQPSIFLPYGIQGAYQPHFKVYNLKHGNVLFLTRRCNGFAQRSLTALLIQAKPEGHSN